MPFGIYQSSSPATVVNSSEPTWAFRLMHEAGITFDGSNNVTAVTEQSQYGLTATSLSLIIRDPANAILGVPALGVTTAGGSAHLKFGEYITPTNRPMLTTGIAYVMLSKTASSNGSSYMMGQGATNSAMELRSTSAAHTGNCLTIAAKGGATVTAPALNTTSWEFRWIIAKIADYIEVGIGTSQSRHTRRTTMTSLAESQFSINSPLVLFNRYSAAGTIGATSSANMYVAELGVIDPAQVEQCRRFWANKYSLTL